MAPSWGQGEPEDEAHPREVDGDTQHHHDTASRGPGEGRPGYHGCLEALVMSR